MYRTFVAALVVLAGLAVTPVADAAPSARSEHQRIVEYWTPERRASAIPMDQQLAGGPQAMAKPGSGSGDVTGATWTAGGSVSYTTGKVFFTLNGTRYTCSGSAAASSHGNLVLSAGHCVHDGDNGAFATDWVFYPHWDGNPDPALGAWTATDLFTTEVWATTANGFDDDAGFAVVTNGTSTTLESALTAVAGVSIPSIEFAEPAEGTIEHAFGYPAAKKYSGNTLTYCSGPVKVRYDSNNTLALNCDMTGGSSGGPWFKDFSTTTNTGTINSLNSYGYASLRNVMFGPIFGSGEKAAYTGADTADCDATTAEGYRCFDHSDPVAA